MTSGSYVYAIVPCTTPLPVGTTGFDDGALDVVCVGELAAVSSRIERATPRLPPRDTWIFITGPVRQDLVATPWDKRLQPVDLGLTAPQLAKLEVYRLL